MSPICFIPTVILNLHLQQISNPYLLGARWRWLRVNCVEKIGIWPVLKTWNRQRLGNLPSARKYWSCYPVSTKANGFQPWYIPSTSWTPAWVVERSAIKKYTAYMASSNKKRLNETSQNQTRIMRQQSFLDYLLLNLWKRSASSNSRLPP